MRRTLKFSLAIVFLAAAPFCWSIARDLTPIFFASSEEAEIAKAAIALQLVAGHKRMHVGENPPLTITSVPHNCYAVSKKHVRTKFRLLNKKIDGIDENFRSRSDMVTMNGHNIPYAFFAEQLGSEALQKNLSSFHLSVLNACMAASPFTKRCDASIEKNMKFEHGGVERRLVMFGFMRHAISEHDSEMLCTTIPAIEDSDA